MNPLPNDLPAWVHWLAQDADGTWWGYEVEPLQRDYGWYENELGRNIRLRAETPSPDWEHSLQRITRNSSQG